MSRLGRLFGNVEVVYAAPESAEFPETNPPIRLNIASKMAKMALALAQKSFKHFGKTIDFDLFGPSWRTSWRPLGQSWRPLGGVLGRLDLEAILGRLGRILGGLGGILDALGPSWRHLGPSWAI